MNGCATAVLVAVLVVFADFAEAADPTRAVVKIEAEGCAKGTSPSSRDAAVLNAERSAVNSWIELELGSAPGDVFLPLVEASSRYRASSRVRRVRSEEGRTCVEIEVYLYEWPLRVDTAAVLLRRRAIPPKIAFLVMEEETQGNSRVFQENARSAKLFSEAFATRGFTLIPPASADDLRYSERELMSIIEAGPAALARYGVEQGADAVVAVGARMSATRPAAAGARVFRTRAQVHVQVVGSVDGRVHAEADGEAEIDTAVADEGYGFALADAVFKVRDSAVTGAILASESGGGTHIRLTMKNLPDFAVAERYAELLRGLDGMEEVKVLSVRRENALLQLSYGGRMSALVRRLDAGAPGLPKLEVLQAVDTEILVRVTP